MACESLRRPFLYGWLYRNPSEILEFVAHVGEGRIELVAQCFHCSDGGNGDEGCDQTIFDGGSAGFIAKERFEKVRHLDLLSDDGVALATKKRWYPAKDDHSKKGGSAQSETAVSAHLSYEILIVF